MAGKIPAEFIDQLLGRTDVVEVIDTRVRLKKAGKEYQALCPFHTEKSPSFTVSQEKQFYHCFGCGAHGTAIGFLMEYEHMAFPEAVEELARQAGMEVPRSSTPYDKGPDPQPSYRILEQADEYFRQQLRSHPEAPQAVEYLKDRGLSGQVAAEFSLGFAPPGWDGLLKKLGSDPNKRGLLSQNGLIIEQDHKAYDRFRNRIMFPIRNRSGRIVGFGGRVLGDDKPKYLNSPETPLFHKGRELYGLYEARKALRRIERLLIVEGYMDVIALAQFGIRYAVATLGTATTADHLELLFRVCPELVFCFDGDRAGRDAAWKALQTALPLARDGREIRFLFLPDGEDPDSQVRKTGPESFEEQIRTAQHLSDFLFAHLSSQMDMDSMDGRAHLAERAKPLLEKLPAGVFREMMTNQLAQILSLPTNRLGIQPAPQNHTHRPRRHQSPQRATPVRKAIAVVLQHPQTALVATQIEALWRTLDKPGIGLLTQLLELTQFQPTLSTAALVERWRDTEHFIPLNKLAQYDLSGANADPEKELIGALKRLNEQAREQEQERLFSRTTLAGMSEEDKAKLRALYAKQTNDDKS